MRTTAPENNLERPIAITMGDAAGIGPELCVRLLSQAQEVPGIIYGDLVSLQRALALTDLDQVFRLVAISHPIQYARISSVENQIPVLQCGPPLPEDLPYGEVNAEAGKMAYDALNFAIQHANEGHVRAIVTAPLNKDAMHQAGIQAPGHTEILAEKTNTEHYAMMLMNDEIKVMLATIHIPLKEVSSQLSIEKQLQTIQLAHQFCQQAQLPTARIAVAGLNPHAGEAGQFGTEEIEIIQPAIEQARQRGIDVSGPWPGDTIFMRARRGEFDIVVAQYHDQGLIPVKYMGLEQGVNVTVGLPFIRTSVDHGTAYDIAGQGIADERSLQSAYDAAIALSNA
ncbi:MAG TPA: 4-hydroxythreonine-4-phosphate dehydrogenase PdxA [Paenalcaligenes sp.]|nr:4-hydroxythreonine-4-phosphate dehydrogenase PdxA [Paenalcaligenes sp.]